MKLFASLFLLSVATVAQAAPKNTILGVWQGTAIAHDHPVPIVLQVTGTPEHLQAALLNGTDSTAATSATFSNGHLLLAFNYFARTLEADIENGTLTGNFGGKRGGFVPITLHHAPLRNAPKLAKTNLLGDWEVETKSEKGEPAWQLRIAASDTPNATVRAVIQRIDGDTGALYGVLPANPRTGEPFQISHLTAAGPALYKITPQSNGTLIVENLLSDKYGPLVARRPAEARKQNLAPPTDTAQQTTMKDPNARFLFSAPDLTGKTVSNADPQFDGKVVIVAIGGSWCPNCHDEAPFLVELYQKFHAQGLEVVNLSFEEDDQLKNPTRLHAFIERYHIPYTVLLAGNTDQLNEKITQANNLNCWPTSFFVGRDGKVKEIHAGFAGPGNPAANQALKHEVTELVEHLLAEPAPTQSASLKP